jgi:hypothetical protein
MDYYSDLKRKEMLTHATNLKHYTEFKRPGILPTHGAEVRKISVQSLPGKIVLKTLS